MEVVAIGGENDEGLDSEDTLPFQSQGEHLGARVAEHAPTLVFDDEFLKNASDAVLSVFEQTRGHAKAYWVWSRRRDGLDLVAYSDARAEPLEANAVDALVSSLPFTSDDERLNCTVMNSAESSWMILWNPIWVALLLDVPIGFAIISYDAART